MGGSWRVDETFIKVRGQWMYLYRAVDGQGNTVEFFLSRTRGIAAAKAFFRKALKHHREPHSITLDGHRPSPSALRRMGMNGEFNFRGPNPVRIRCCQYLNNVVEQDHRRVKGRLRPMLGFKTFYNARRVIIGIELAQKIHKRQFAIPTPWQSNPAVIWRYVIGSIGRFAGGALLVFSLRKSYLHQNPFQEAQIVIELWREEYNFIEALSWPVECRLEEAHRAG